MATSRGDDTSATPMNSIENLTDVDDIQKALDELCTQEVYFEKIMQYYTSIYLNAAKYNFCFYDSRAFWVALKGR